MSLYPSQIQHGLVRYWTRAPVVKNRGVINIINGMRRLWELRSSGLDSWPLKMGPIGCPETSVRNYHYLLRNSPEGRSSHLLCGGSLKWRKMRLRTQCWYQQWDMRREYTSREAYVLRRPRKASATSIHCKRETRNSHYRVHFKLSQQRDHTGDCDIHLGGEDNIKTNLWKRNWFEVVQNSFTVWRHWRSAAHTSFPAAICCYKV